MPHSVDVTVDGVPAAGWAYDEALQAVVFDCDDVPDEGSAVAISYVVCQPCDDGR